MTKITVVVKEPGRVPESRKIENSFKAFQEIVGGYIETVRTPFAGVLLLVDEDGRSKELPPNIAYTMGIVPPIPLVGSIVAVKESGENFIGLSHYQVKLIKNWLDVRSVTEGGAL